MKKRYYVLFVIVIMLLQGYYYYLTRDLFVPKQEEIVNTKPLFREVFSEITKYDKDSDTIFFVKYDPARVVCGLYSGKSYKTKHEMQLEQIEYNTKNPYFIDIEKAIDQSYTFNDRLIIVGNTQYSNGKLRFYSSNQDSKGTLPPYFYRLLYKIINKNKVEVVVTVNYYEVMNLILTQNKGKWIAKQIEL